MFEKRKKKKNYELGTNLVLSICPSSPWSRRPQEYGDELEQHHSSKTGFKKTRWLEKNGELTVNCSKGRASSILASVCWSSLSSTSIFRSVSWAFSTYDATTFKEYPTMNKTQSSPPWPRRLRWLWCEHLHHTSQAGTLSIFSPPHQRWPDSSEQRGIAKSL